MKGRLLTSILAMLSLTGLHAQSQPSVPRMVVGLAIDRLRTDYVEAFASLYGERGFKRLWKEGKVYANAEHTFADADRSSAIAAIYTGSPPALNGIIANQRLDINTLRAISCVDDPGYLGYYTNENSSPGQLLTSTVGDELKSATLGRAQVFAIAPWRDAAILGAGHAGDAALWINESTGKWAGTTYYKEFPWWANQYNDRSTARPRRPAGSPLVNDEVNALVEYLLKNTTIGEDDIPDFLSVTYAADSLQETYVGLDNSIANLIDMIDRKVGLRNVVLMVTSTGYTPAEEADRERFRIPGGEFHINRCAALLNMYLMATYGEGHYVEGYYGLRIFLNHKLIENKQLDLSEVQAKAAEFLVQFSGVDEVYTANRLLLGAWSPEGQKKRNAFHRKRSGDLVIGVLPGWSIVNENTSESPVVRYGQAPAPLFFFGSTIKPEIIRTPVGTDHIAPTLTHILRIRAPNGCSAAPLDLN